MGVTEPWQEKDDEQGSIFFLIFKKILKHSHTIPHTFKHKIHVHIFSFQVSAAVNSLQEIYAKQDEEASSLFKITTSSMNLYKNKIQTMDKTRQLIRYKMGEEVFELWDGQFVARKPMQLWELDINTVSIVIFLDFFKIMHQTLLNSFTHFWTSIFREILRW